MNIIYIHCHDAGRYLSPYRPEILTPNLNSFAGEAVVFTQAFCNAPTCSPSRAALLTGMTAHQAGMLGLTHRGFALNSDEDHLCRFLARHGYETALCGVQHEWPFEGKVPPYETIIPQVGTEDREELENDLNIARAAAAFLHSREDGEDCDDGGRSHTLRPLFLAVGFYYPHRILPSAEDRFLSDKTPLPSPLPDSPSVRGDMAAYQTAAWWMDQAFGVLWQAIKETGLTENSLILFTTDHGIPFPRMKANLTVHGTGVTFLLKAPGQAVTRCDGLVSHLDYFPTVCDYAGLSVPPTCVGRSLRPLLEGHPGASGAGEVFGEVNFHAAYEPKRSLRTTQFNYIRNYETELHPALANIDPSPSKDWMLEQGLLPYPVPVEELYDLSQDPEETRNLVDSPDYAGALADMRTRLDRWMQETNDPLLQGPITPPAGSRLEPPVKHQYPQKTS